MLQGDWSRQTFLSGDAQSSEALLAFSASLDSCTPQRLEAEATEHRCETRNKQITRASEREGRQVMSPRQPLSCPQWDRYVTSDTCLGTLLSRQGTPWLRQTRGFHEEVKPRRNNLSCGVEDTHTYSLLVSSISFALLQTYEADGALHYWPADWLSCNRPSLSQRTFEHEKIWFRVPFGQSIPMPIKLLPSLKTDWKEIKKIRGVKRNSRIISDRVSLIVSTWNTRRNKRSVNLSSQTNNLYRDSTRENYERRKFFQDP